MILPPTLTAMSLRLRAAVSLFALLVLAGCGDDAKTARPSASPTRAPLTAEQAKPAAAAAILTAADLPGYAVKAETADPTDAADAKKLYTCLGVPAPSYLAEDPGNGFSKATTEITSSADVATSASDSRALLAAFTGPKAQPCFKEQINAFSKEQGVTTSSLEFTPTQISVPGADGAFFYTFSLDGTSPDGPLKISGFLAGSLVGQVQITVDAFGLDPLTITSDQVVELLRTSTDRAIAHLAKS